MTLIGIIGGAGRMGSYFADIFSNANYDVLISDINEERLKQMREKGHKTAPSEEVASLTDLVVFSVPIIDTPNVIRQYAPLVKGEGKGISDLTSTKIDPVKAMLEASNPEVEVIGMHPMFGPSVNMEGQNVVLLPIRPEEGGIWKGRLEKLIKDNGANYFHTTPEKHDHYMSLVQGLPHAIQFIAAETFRTLDVDLEELSKFSSKFYDMFFDVLWRVFGINNPELYSQIQIGNPNNQRVLEVMGDVLRKHTHLIGQGKIEDFSKMYRRDREFLGTYAEIAKKRTAPLVGKPV